MTPTGLPVSLLHYSRLIIMIIIIIRYKLDYKMIERNKLVLLN